MPDIFDHVDIFSGIGGFTLAAHANGLRTVALCEIDKRCRNFLSKAWPGIYIHTDIREFDGTAYNGAFLLTAGVPCQPASRAGKQRGAADDRWLWPEAIRVLGQVKPTWAIFENPPGIGDVGLAGILADVEGQGYEVRVFSIPACAVGAPHRRERYWIVGNRTGESRKVLQRRWRQQNINDGGSISEFADGDQWNRFVWLPCADGKFRRAPDDSIELVNGLHRSLLAALGNSIVPQVAYKIIAAIIESDNA
jgi:DNA (cytosine-5)-methyltransferase 1